MEKLAKPGIGMGEGKVYAKLLLHFIQTLPCNVDWNLGFEYFFVDLDLAFIIKLTFHHLLIFVALPESSI